MTIHVAGSTGRVLKADGGRLASAGSAGSEPWPEPSGFLLDLVTDAAADVDSLRRLAETAAAAVTGSVGVQIDCAATLTSPQGLPVLAANNGRAAGLAALEKDLNDGPLAQAREAGIPVIVEADGGPPLRWQAYRCRFLDAGYGEVLAVPVRLDAGMSCALGFFAPRGVRFAPETVCHAMWFAGVAAKGLGLALEVRSIRAAGDNLKAVLESRTSIDVACGVIMGRNRCSYPDAFHMIAGASSRRGMPVREVAEAILKNLPSGSPRTRFEV
ncbi:GAF and ANTAR domain-containing protein [Arthrobacter sp. Z4-13]